MQCVDCVRAQSRGTRSARTVFGGAAGSGRPVVTLAIIAVCVVMFALQYLSHDRVTEALAFYPQLAVAEPYRFLTAAFLHSTSFILHIAFNLYALWIVGPYLERLLGRAQYAALYLLAAVGGSVGYFVLVSPSSDNWYVPTLGASGAVFGLFGAWFVVNRRLGRDVTGIVALVLINGAGLPARDRLAGAPRWPRHRSADRGGVRLPSPRPAGPALERARRRGRRAPGRRRRPRTDAPRGRPGGASHSPHCGPAVWITPL